MAPKQPPNYFSRGEQYRLFVLCAALMLVLWMMNEARKPKNWDWLWAGDRPATPKVETPIDTRLLTTEVPLPSDGFRAKRPNELTTSGDETLNANFLPGLEPELLTSVEDNTLLKASDSEAWYAILSLLRNAREAEVQAASMGPVSFAQLFRQTEVYRGRVVSVGGTAHRIESLTSPDNRAELTHLYRWIVEPSGPSNAPLVVYTLEKPAGLAPGDDLREEVKFAAVCFKRWVYEAGDGARIAPLLLAKTATWMRPAPAEPVKLPSAVAMAGLFVALSVVAGAAALLVYRNSVRQRPEVQRVRAANVSPIQPRDEDVLPSVTESLGKIAAEHRGEAES